MAKVRWYEETEGTWYEKSVEDWCKDADVDIAWCEEIENASYTDVDDADIDYDDYPYWSEEDANDDDFTDVDEQWLEDRETDRRFWAEEAKRFFEGKE
ncbi:MAG: hypothetical protein IJS47_02260 [Clostridia bacterium]|nr:hypothetical protein [Clostridia bacterium]